MSKFEELKQEMIIPKKIQLHTGMEGFNSPSAFGIYRHTGGEALGVVGKDYTPPDLHLFADLTRDSLNACADWLDQDKVEYVELKGGKKIRISIPGPVLEPKIKTIGTTFQMRLDFMTGFDGLTKTQLGVFGLNLWCMNGAKRWEGMYNLSFKNTKGNQGKWALFCNEIIQALNSTKDYEAFLNKAATVQYTQKDVDAFFEKVLGYSQKDYTEMTTRKRNILDKINSCVAIESQANGTNMYSLLGGVTRYTTHEMAGGDLDHLLTETSGKINDKAQREIGVLIGMN